MSATLVTSGELEDVLGRATQRSIRRRHQFCPPEQVLEILLEDLGETRALRPVVEDLDDRAALSFAPPFAELSRSLRVRALPAAREVAAEEGTATVEPRHLLHALLGPDAPIRESLRAAVLSGLRGRHAEARNAKPTERTDRSGPEARVPATNESTQADPARGFLEPIELDAADEALADRPESVEQLAQSLLFGSAVIVGPPGSGRRSLIRLFARRRREGRLPKMLLEAPLLSLDLMRLVAGTSYRGELEERLQQTFQELEANSGPVLVSIEDIHLLVGTGASGGGFDVASSLIEPLRRGRIRLLGTTTADAQREVLERHPVLLERLTPVVLSPPDRPELTEILVSAAERARIELGPTAMPDAIDAVARLASQHLPHLALPGSAVRLLRAALSRHAFETEMHERDPERRHGEYWRIVRCEPGDRDAAIGSRHVMLALAQLHGLPLDHLEVGVEEKIRGFDAAFRQNLFGQEHVLPELTKSLKVALRNLSDPDRPRGRLFLLGPPGVGKTECAKLLARYLHGRDDALVRLDMSEFQEASSTASLIGSDKGLVGSDEGGRLTEPLRQNPNRVVLLDEIEKAHPQVYHLFLQILDNGEIHDKRGRRISFRHAIVVFTSNAGVDPGADLRGASRSELVARLSRTFRPEFLNRVETFLPFVALDAEARRKVLRLHLERFATQLRAEHGLSLEWSDEVCDLAGEPPEGEVGARHVLRWLQSELKPRVADSLTEALQTGGRIRLEAGAGGLRVTVLSEPRRAG